MSNDEPTSPRPDPFCIQPWDPQALSIIRVWIMTARAMKVNVDKLVRAEQHFEEIRKWQTANGTKVPD